MSCFCKKELLQQYHEEPTYTFVIQFHSIECSQLLSFRCPLLSFQSLLCLFFLSLLPSIFVELNLKGAEVQ